MKRLVAILLTVLLLTGTFTACGNNSNGSSGSTDSNVLKIGSIGPGTGDASTYGNAVKYGSELAVEEINAAGGINGIKIEFKFEDDECDAEKSVNAYNTLKDWGMQILSGTVTSACCISVVSEAANDEIFLLTPSATAVECIAPDNAFRVCFSDPNQGVKSADYIADNKLASKVAVIYNNADAYSSGIYENFKSEATKKGLTVTTAEAFTNDNASDFTAQLQNIKKSGAELVFLPIYVAPATLILKQAKSMGLNVKFFGCDGLDGILKQENFDKSLAEDLMLLTPFTENATDEKTVKFVNAFKDKYGEEYLNQFAADAYDSIYIIKAAAEKAGITTGMSNSEICNKLKVAMGEITFDGLTATGMTWDVETGEPNKAPKAIVIKNGEYIEM